MTGGFPTNGAKRSAKQSRKGKKKDAPLTATRLMNQGLHVAYVIFQRPPPRCRQLVFSLRQPAFKRFLAKNVAGLLQFTCVHAEVSVSRVQQLLQIVECQRRVAGQRADDSQAQTLMYQPLQ